MLQILKSNQENFSYLKLLFVVNNGAAKNTL